MTEQELDRVILSGHQMIENTELSGCVRDYGLEIGEHSSYPDAIAVQIKDIPGLITWLTIQWSNMSKN